MELIIILIIFVTAFVIAVNTRKKHVSMENNVSPNNIPSEDGQFKHENRLSIISGHCPKFCVNGNRIQL